MKKFLITVPALFFGYTAFAQAPIIFGQTNGMYIHDIADTTIGPVGCSPCNSVFEHGLDLDGDHIADLTFKSSSFVGGQGSGKSISVTTQADVHLAVDTLYPEIRITSTDTTAWMHDTTPVRFAAGDTIPLQGYGRSSGRRLISESYVSTPGWRFYIDRWAGSVNNYLAIRKYRTSDTLTGWVRISVPSYNLVTIHEYAWNKEVTGVTEQSTRSDITLFPNPAANFISLSTPTDMSVSIFDLRGNEVQTISCPSGTTRIETTELKNGLYIALCRGEEGVKAIRFVKQ